MTGRYLCCCVQCQVYLLAAFPLGLNYWKSNQIWIPPEQNLKGVLDKWITSKKDMIENNFGSLYQGIFCLIIKSIDTSCWSLLVTTVVSIKFCIDDMTSQEMMLDCGILYCFSARLINFSAINNAIFKGNFVINFS